MGNFQASGWLGLGVAVAFLVDWAAIAMDWRAIKPFSKPLAMVILIFWTALSAEAGISLPVGWLLAAQVFGLLGDILLILPEKAFLAGLGAFLGGHLIYLGLLIGEISALFSAGGLRINHSGQFVFGFVLWIGVLALIYRLFRRLPHQKGALGLLWMAIQAYSWILSGMMVLALMAAFLVDGTIGDRLILPAGAFLFLVSDSMLGYNRFIHPFDRAQLWVRITYHLAQFSLAWGFLALIG